MDEPYSRSVDGRTAEAGEPGPPLPLPKRDKVAVNKKDTCLLLAYP